MKYTKFLLLAAITIMALFYSCNNADDKKDDAAKTDAAATEAQKTTEAASTPAPVKPENILLIMHKVANYAKWLPVYEGDDSVRTANGLSNFVIGRGMGKDSNTVLVALRMADVAKAKALTSSAILKEKMKKGGVVGAPISIEFLEPVMMDTNTNVSVNRVRITHKVKDWDAWKKEFDSHKQVRMDAGLIDRSVGHAIDDNHMVSLVFAISDMAKAKTFMDSKDLKDKMTAAGVVGPPTIFYYSVAKKY